jgi:hypothetical protein
MKFWRARREISATLFGSEYSEIRHPGQGLTLIFTKNPPKYANPDKGRPVLGVSNTLISGLTPAGASRGLRGKSGQNPNNWPEIRNTRPYQRLAENRIFDPQTRKTLSRIHFSGFFGEILAIFLSRFSETCGIASTSLKTGDARDRSTLNVRN